MDYGTLSELVKCGVCKDRIKQPKTLPCNHSFCMDCINETHRCRPNTTNDAKCPVCRRQFVLTYGGAKELPDNFHLSELLEKLERARKDGTDDKAPIPCQKCPDKSATSTCVECNQNLCDKCVEIHSAIPDATNHHIFNLSDLDHSQREALVRMTMVTAKCMKHNLLPSRYCLDKLCMKLVCPECCLDAHKTHDLLNLNESASLSRQKLKSISGDAQLMEVKTRREIDRFDQIIADKSAAKDSFKVQVSMRFAEFREKLSKFEEQLLDKGCRKYDEAISKVERHKRESENKMANIAEIVQKAKVTEEVGTNAFLVSEQHHLEGCLEEVENERAEMNDSDNNVNIEIVKEKDSVKISEGQIYRIQETAASQGREGSVSSEDEKAMNVVRITEHPDEDLREYRMYENTHQIDSRRPERTRSVLSLPLPSPPSHSYIRHLSYPSLNVEDNYRYCNFSDSRQEFPTRLSFERKMHIDVSSMISGLTVTRNNEIIAALENEKKVLIIKYDERTRETTVCYNVKWNWIQPWDAAASYDEKRKRTTVYVTDSDNTQGYIVSFETKRKEVVKTKTLVSSRRLQPKGITTNDSDIFVCDSEQRCIIVYQASGQFKHKIGLANTFTHPMYIGRVDDDTLIVTDDIRGSIVRVKTNGEFVSETSLDSNSLSQVDVDFQGTMFVGNFRTPMLHALIDNKKYTVEGDFEGICQTTALAVDNQSRVVVGHSKGIEVLQINYRYGDTYS